MVCGLVVLARPVLAVVAALIEMSQGDQRHATVDPKIRVFITLAV